MEGLEFIKVTGEESNVRELYMLLGKRTFNISHQNLPGFEEHKKFVQNHPYRVWYIVRSKNDIIGTCYIMNNNCLSVFLVQGEESHFNEVIAFLTGNFVPLEEVKSVRPPYFFINVAKGNVDLMQKVSALGWKELQTTFACV